MQTRRLGSTDLVLTTVGLGTWAIGGPWEYGWGPQDDGEAVTYSLGKLDDRGRMFVSPTTNTARSSRFSLRCRSGPEPSTVTAPGAVGCPVQLLPGGGVMAETNRPVSVDPAAVCGVSVILMQCHKAMAVT